MIGKSLENAMVICNRYKCIKFLIKYLLIIVIVMITSCGEDPHKDLYGHWKIYKHTPALHAIGCLLQAEIDQMIDYLMGKELVLAKDYIIIDGIKHEKPVYKLREENNANEYFGVGYRVPDKQVLGIKHNTIKILNINIAAEEYRTLAIEVDSVWSHCVHLTFDEMVYYNNELIVSFDTEFFHLKKVK